MTRRQNFFLSQLAATQGRPANESEGQTPPGEGTQAIVPGENGDDAALTKVEAVIDDSTAVIEEAAATSADDAVGEVAVESLRHNMALALRSGFGLEALADQLTETIEGDGQGVTAETAQMLQTASEPLGGDEGENKVALEAFGYDTRLATESMADDAEKKSEGFFKSVGSAITKIAEAVKQRVTGFLDFMKNSNEVLAKMLAESRALEKMTGKPIDDELQLKRMRGHWQGTGNGTEAVVQMISRGLPAMIDVADDIFAATARLSQALDPNDPQAVSREAKRFYDAVAKAAATKLPGVELTFVPPESTELEALANSSTAKVRVGYKALDEGGNQTYTVLAEGQLDKLVRGTRDVQGRWNSIALNGEASKMGDGFIARLLKSRKASDENKQQAVLARKAYANLMTSANMISRDATFVGVSIGMFYAHHALMVARASFDAAKKAGKAPASDAAAA